MIRGESSEGTLMYHDEARSVPCGGEPGRGGGSGWMPLSNRAALAATPHPGPPPQGGREDRKLGEPLYLFTRLPSK
jgi:hypothetical protein